jgi:Tfp pilus assembly protein PilX
MMMGIMFVYALFAGMVIVIVVGLLVAAGIAKLIEKMRRTGTTDTMSDRKFSNKNN